MTIKRGITDATLMCVYPWERPLIEEIHGGNAVVISIDSLCSTEGVKNVKPIKPKERVDLNGKKMVADMGGTQRQKYEAMVAVDPEENPLQDPDAEWGRMVERYGMHPDIKVTVVEKVYGSSRMFRQCMREFAAGKVPEFLRDDDAEDSTVDDVAGETLAVADMTAEQMRKELTERGVTFKKGAARDDLEALLMEAREPQQAAA